MPKRDRTAIDDRFPGNKNNLPNEGTRKRGAIPEGGTGRPD